MNDSDSTADLAPETAAAFTFWRGSVPSDVSLPPPLHTHRHLVCCWAICCCLNVFSSNDAFLSIAAAHSFFLGPLAPGAARLSPTKIFVHHRHGGFQNLWVVVLYSLKRRGIRWGAGYWCCDFWNFPTCPATSSPRLTPAPHPPGGHQVEANYINKSLSALDSGPRSTTVAASAFSDILPPSAPSEGGGIKTGITCA